MATPSHLKTAQSGSVQGAFRLLNSVVQPAVQAGLANPLCVGPGAIVLETTGRVSGKKRPVPLLATRVADTLVVSTVRDDSQWLKNVEADPAVTVWLNGTPRAATAKVSRAALSFVTLTLV